MTRVVKFCFARLHSDGYDRKLIKDKDDKSFELTSLVV